jgi:ADP-ribose pyrophosphatase YjhB (NUDIX family)
MLREKSAGGLVERAGRLLLVKVRNLSGDIVWTLPKGHLEAGETAQQAALREVAEETGWTCRIKGKLPTAAYFFRRGRRLVSKRVLWFLMKPEKKTGVRDPEEILAVRWFSAKSAAEKLRYPSDLKLLAAFHGRRSQA